MPNVAQLSVNIARNVGRRKQWSAQRAAGNDAANPPMPVGELIPGGDGES